MQRFHGAYQTFSSAKIMAVEPTGKLFLSFNYSGAFFLFPSSLLRIRYSFCWGANGLKPVPHWERVAPLPCQIRLPVLAGCWYLRLTAVPTASVDYCSPTAHPQWILTTPGNNYAPSFPRLDLPSYPGSFLYREEPSLGTRVGFCHLKYFAASNIQWREKTVWFHHVQYYQVQRRFDHVCKPQVAKQWEWS